MCEPAYSILVCMILFLCIIFVLVHLQGKTQSSLNKSDNKDLLHKSDNKDLLHDANRKAWQTLHYE